MGQPFPHPIRRERISSSLPASAFVQEVLSKSYTLRKTWMISFGDGGQETVAVVIPLTIFSLPLVVHMTPRITLTDTTDIIRKIIAPAHQLFARSQNSI